VNPKDENHVRHRFDSYCKKVLKGAARNHYEAQRKRAEREVPLSQLSEQELSKLTALDEYFEDGAVFDVRGEAVGVFDGDIADALKKLPQDKRDIVLLSYFMELTDYEIADRLNMVRRTVTHRRTSSLRELKTILEEYGYE
jgi:RNA polymerase sigma factor (sigma-70 family)